MLLLTGCSFCTLSIDCILSRRTCLGDGARTLKNEFQPDPGFRAFKEGRYRSVKERMNVKKKQCIEFLEISNIISRIIRM